MKKRLIVIIAAACTLVLALAGCSSGASSAASSAAGEAASSAEAAASSAASEASEAAGSESASEEPQAGMPNPWSDVASADEAAAGAGIDSFSVPEGESISLGPIDHVHYRCMDGLAEAVVKFPAVEMRLRKGTSEVAEVADIPNDVSGDYGDYKQEWVVSVDGIDATCYGNREAEATKTIWTNGDYCYSITVQGLGGDDDYGLPLDDLATLIGALK